LVKWSWFKPYEGPPLRRGGDRIAQSWDTASKAEEANDYSVSTTWLVRGRTSSLLDLTRLRVEYPDLGKRIVLEADRHNARFNLIDDAGSGIHLRLELKRSTSLNTYGVRPKDDKATRLMSVSPIIEAGRVMIPAEANWLDAFRHELILFPNSKHDD
jgi:predicted phage terminase large subunit-like protein